MAPNGFCVITAYGLRMKHPALKARRKRIGKIKKGPRGALN